MANIKVNLTEVLHDGSSVTFKAPCACNAIDGITVIYPDIVDDVATTVSKTFKFKDAHGNDLTSVNNLFAEGAYIKVVFDTANCNAYLQNADSNGYIERRLNVRTATLSASSWSSSAPYTQTVNVADITANDQPIISVGTPTTLSSASYKALIKAYAMIDRAVTGAGTITFYCYTKKPATDIPVLIKGA